MRSPSDDRRQWWVRRRGVFSGTVLVGYAVSVVLYETSTPWWAGDQIGLSGPAIVVGYGTGGLLLLLLANVLFLVPRLLEPKEPERVGGYRSRAFAVTLGLGAVFPLVLLMAWFVAAWSEHRPTSLTHARPPPPGCRAQADGHAILCGGQVAARLACSDLNHGDCNVLALTYADGETVNLHELRGDPKFDKVYDIRVSSTGDRIWFTEWDLSTSAMLLNRNGGMSRRARAYDVWSGKLMDADGEAAAGTVPLAPETTPFGSRGDQLDKAMREGTQVEVTNDNNGLPIFVAPRRDGKP